jgi:hypothetical protein
MRLPKKFEEYVKDGIVRRTSPDKSRARFLIDEAGTTLEGLKERVEKIGINEKNANSIIKDCYDIIMELIRAKLLLDGYNSSGQYSHEAEVSYILGLKISENEVVFLNELRYFRNSVTYYGKILNKEYAEKVFVFMNRLLPQLHKMLN